ncbi:hypothetical protein NS2_03400 [Nocardia seriolae NBRC 15557]|nr:hypothetical protein NS2_03400 [Nocardia seriolae NBRC 15557]
MVSSGAGGGGGAGGGRLGSGSRASGSNPVSPQAFTGGGSQGASGLAVAGAAGSNMIARTAAPENARAAVGLERAVRIPATVTAGPASG